MHHKQRLGSKNSKIAEIKMVNKKVERSAKYENNSTKILLSFSKVSICPSTMHYDFCI